MACSVTWYLYFCSGPQRSRFSNGFRRMEKRKKRNEVRNELPYIWVFLMILENVNINLFSRFLVWNFPVSFPQQLIFSVIVTDSHASHFFPIFYLPLLQLLSLSTDPVNLHTNCRALSWFFFLLPPQYIHYDLGPTHSLMLPWYCFHPPQSWFCSLKFYFVSLCLFHVQFVPIANSSID